MTIRNAAILAAATLLAGCSQPSREKPAAPPIAEKPIINHIKDLPFKQALELQEKFLHALSPGLAIDPILKRADLPICAEQEIKSQDGKAIEARFIIGSMVEGYRSDYYPNGMARLWVVNERLFRRGSHTFLQAGGQVYMNDKGPAGNVDTQGWGHDFTAQEFHANSRLQRQLGPAVAYLAQQAKLAGMEGAADFLAAPSQQARIAPQRKLTAG